MARSLGRAPRALVAAVLFLLAAAAAPRAAARIVAIDLGAEHLKIALVKPGRPPIAIVLNEMSKRKTAAAVALVNGDRLVGEEAAVLVGAGAACSTSIEPTMMKAYGEVGDDGSRFLLGDDEGNIHLLVVAKDGAR